MGVAHLDEVEGHELSVGHLHATWSFVGAAAGAIGVGVTRLQIPAGGWSTPAHDHGVEEELFYVLGGRGLSWHKDKTFDIAAGDCILYPMGPGHVVARPPDTGVAHTFRGGDDGLTYLAYGTREPGDVCFYPDSNKVIISGVAFRIEPIDYWDGED